MYACLTMVKRVFSSILYCMQCTVCFTDLHSTLFVLSDHDPLLSLSPLQSTSPNWDSTNMWSTDAPFYSNDITSDMSPLPISSGTTDPTSPSEDTTLSTTTYDLFENQSIWSLSNADSLTLLSWPNRNLNPHKARLSKAPSDLLQRFWITI